MLLRVMLKTHLSFQTMLKLVKGVSYDVIYRVGTMLLTHAKLNLTRQAQTDATDCLKDHTGA